MDLCNLIQNLRAYFFAKDRDVTLQVGRAFDGLGIAKIGMIIMWSGAIVDIPTNWQICDGTNGTPDLQDRFVVGAGNSYAVDDTGGSATVDLQHSHGDGTYATDSDSHRHTSGSLEADGCTQTNTSGTSVPGNNDAEGDHGHDITGYTDYDSHSHDVTGSSDNALSTTEENRPPFYALAYIMRTA